MPVILPPKHRFTLLAMVEAHEFSHAGQDTTVGLFRTIGYWTVCAGKHSYSSCKNKEVSDDVKTVTVQLDQEQENQPEEFHSFSFSVRETKEQKWSSPGLLVDSGATMHIINDKNLFNCVESGSFDKHSLVLADGTKITGTVEGKGKATVKLRDENGHLHQTELSNFLFCSTFPCSIFSVNAATNRNVLFFQKSGGRGGVYIVQFVKISTKIFN